MVDEEIMWEEVVISLDNIQEACCWKKGGEQYSKKEAELKEE